MTSVATTDSGNALLKPTAGIAGGLGLAAAPTFALMAGISAFGSPDTAMCSPVSPLVPINQMALMYLLMSLFHLSPWLRFLPRRRAASRRAITQMQGD